MVKKNILLHICRSDYLHFLWWQKVIYKADWLACLFSYSAYGVCCKIASASGSHGVWNTFQHLIKNEFCGIHKVKVEICWLQCTTADFLGEQIIESLWIQHQGLLSYPKSSWIIGRYPPLSLSSVPSIVWIQFSCHLRSNCKCCVLFIFPTW